MCASSVAEQSELLALSFMLFSWMAKKYFAITNHLQPEPEAEFDSFEKTRTYLVDKANRIHKTLALKIAFMRFRAR
jgi:hypothetical protein